ncbi:MAG: hypothetical protein F6J97_08625, partial [Leptolyngbya sp. SIO4C1]|nr:hypothetical protein [Leptolyngbya sp. SIO4C1]
SYELFSPAVLDQLGEAADGALLAVPDEIYMSAASPFRDRAQALWGQATDWRTTASYNATQRMILGLRQASDRETLQKVISTQNAEQPRSVRLLKVEKRQDGEYDLISVGLLVAEDMFVPN